METKENIEHEMSKKKKKKERNKQLKNNDNINNKGKYRREVLETQRHRKQTKIENGKRSENSLPQEQYVRGRLKKMIPRVGMCLDV